MTESGGAVLEAAGGPYLKSTTSLNFSLEFFHRSAAKSTGLLSNTAAPQSLVRIIPFPFC